MPDPAPLASAPMPAPALHVSEVFTGSLAERSRKRRRQEVIVSRHLSLRRRIPDSGYELNDY
jgi:hypothetical protein